MAISVDLDERIKTDRRRDRRGATPVSPAAARFTSPGTNGTSGIARAARTSAAAASWKSATTSKTRWSSPPSSTRFVNHAHILKIANMAQLVNVIAPIFTNERACFCRPSTTRWQLFANNSKGKVARPLRRRPRVQATRFDDVPYLDASAALTTARAVINVVNRHRSQSDRDASSRRRTRRSPERSRSPRSTVPTSKPRTISGKRPCSP